MQNFPLFNFTKDSDISKWQIIDDGVMGGRSNGSFNINNDGYGEFSGKVSLENNGGFSSVHYNFNTIDCKAYSKFIIHLKADGKNYQFRVKDRRNQKYAFIYEFETSGEWQTIEIPFSKMYASYRGYRMDIPNFQGHQMEEIAFLVGNKKSEDFKLIIDTIYLN